MSMFRTKAGWLALKKDMTKSADPVLAPAVFNKQAEFAQAQTNFTLPKDFVNPVATAPGSQRRKVTKKVRRTFSGLGRLFRFRF